MTKLTGRDTRSMAEQIGREIDKGWHIVGSGGAFSLVLDDLMCCVTNNRMKHHRALSEKERDWLFGVGRMIGQAFESLPPFTDLLGPIYMDVSGRGHKSAMGQYFTPQTVCDCMASIAMHDAWRSIIDKAIDSTCRGRELTGINEPCCGSGAMLLAGAKHITQELGDVDWLKHVYINGNDLDITCVKMTSIQLMAQAWLHNVEYGLLEITHGDALTWNVKPYLSVGRDLNIGTPVVSPVTPLKLAV